VSFEEPVRSRRLRCLLKPGWMLADYSMQRCITVHDAGRLSSQYARYCD